MFLRGLGKKSWSANQRAALHVLSYTYAQTYEIADWEQYSIGHGGHLVVF